MAVPASPKLSDVVAEFGGPGNLAVYVRGGTYVPNIPANAAISTTAAGLALSQFAGATKATTTLALSAHTIYDNGSASGGYGLAKITFANTGSLDWSTNWSGAGSYTNEWATNLDSAGNYEVMGTTSGTAPVGGTMTGTMGTWLNLATTQAWSYGRNPATTATWNIAFQLRKVGTTTPVYSATITLQASGAGPGGDPCVVMDSWMDPNLRASDMRVGYYMDTFRPEEGFLVRPLEDVRPVRKVPCVKLTTVRGAVLRCSVLTPFNLRTAQRDMEEGHWKRAPEMEGELVLVVRKNEVCWEEVVSVEDIGMQYVIPLSFGGRSFAAGDDPFARVFSHNMAKIIP